MVYKIIAAREGSLKAVLTDREGLAHFATVTGEHRSTRTRAELQGQPTLQGFHGPMYDGTTPKGEPIIRYETDEAYRILST